MCNWIAFIADTVFCSHLFKLFMNKGIQGKRKYFIRLFAITGRKTAKLWHTGPLHNFFQKPFSHEDEDG